VPEVRGHGVGQALLAWLEGRALEWGARRAILETGVRNTAALGLFTSNGYDPMARYVPGRDPSINRAFAKALAPTARPIAEDARQATVRPTPSPPQS
jgi:ribosomal protein S18 acetylase RimI-like enzyme